MKHILQITFFVIAMLLIGSVKAAGTIYDDSNHQVCFMVGATEQFAIKGKEKAVMLGEYKRYMREANRRYQEDAEFNNELCAKSIQNGHDFANEFMEKRAVLHHRKG